ncbi:hypothetical protein C8R43DRAFT_1112421 [Mycena crocata]|nr:hypothetical protein C8R43DRAFT_1112421 [Mycena crocata]
MYWKSYLFPAALIQCVASLDNYTNCTNTPSRLKLIARRELLASSSSLDTTQLSVDIEGCTAAPCTFMQGNSYDVAISFTGSNASDFSGAMSRSAQAPARARAARSTCPSEKKLRP